MSFPREQLRKYITNKVYNTILVVIIFSMTNHSSSSFSGALVIVRVCNIFIGGVIKLHNFYGLRKVIKRNNSNFLLLLSENTKCTIGLGFPSQKNHKRSVDDMVVVDLLATLADEYDDGELA
jgi:hypothetical protein